MGQLRPPLRPGLALPALGLALALLAALPAGLVACGGEGRDADAPTVVTFPGSALGAERSLLEQQVARFEAQRPDVRVEIQTTPDNADQRHQLYVQWLNARAPDPDVLQLDVIWTAEFAAAGWIRPLDELGVDASDFFPATLAANRWRGRLFAVPWFVDVGMLYWRTDLFDGPPESLAALAESAAAARRDGRAPEGFVWQGARYEGLVTVFLEVLAGFGGRLLDASGRPAVDSPAGRDALAFLRDAVAEGGASPTDVLTWQEEQARFVFQNGGAAFMRNWPYAAPLLEDPEESRVVGRFAVSPMPGAPAGEPSAALGGGQLALNAASDVPEAAWALVQFLTAPAQMRERAAGAGQYPPRPSLYADGSLEGVLPVAPAAARAVIERAVPRPPTPVYAELSQALQIPLHRALSGQVSVEVALAQAAEGMAAVLDRVPDG